MDAKIKETITGGKIDAPPSKSHTHRAIVMGFLAEGESEIINPLSSSDTMRTLEGVKALGAEVENGKIRRGNFRIPDSVIDCGGSGTTLRLLAGISCLINGLVVFSGNEALRKRPMGDLIHALEGLGARIWSKNGFLPLATRGGLEGGKVCVDCAKSSQFLSSLLISLPLAKKDSEIHVENLKSEPYVEMTVEMLKRFGIDIQKKENTYSIPGHQHYSPQRYEVSGDFSSASFFMVAGAITGKKITVGNLDFQTKQGDKRIVEILKDAGAHVEVSHDSVTVCGGNLSGSKIDCSDNPDLFPILSVLGVFANGETVLHNAPHLHFKESDRIKNMAKELGNLGVRCEERHDGMRIRGGTVKKNVVVDSHDDHRVCMALSIAALMSENTIVKNVECVSESYPHFFEDLKKVGAVIE